MMRSIRSVLRHAAFFALVGAAPAALAVEPAEGEPGQVLIFPYYNAHDGRSSLLSITNRRTDASVALAISAPGADADRPTHFIVYLPPSATWTAAISAQADDAAALFSSDSSCRHPRQEPAELPLMPLSGFVLAFELGVLHTETDLGAAVLPVEAAWGDRPESDRRQRVDCAAVAAAWSEGGVWADDPSRSIEPPRNALTGHMQVIDFARGLGFRVEPYVLKDFSDRVLHGDPATEPASLNMASPAVSRVAVDGETVISQWARGVDAVSAVLMSRSASSDVWLLPEFAAYTDLILTFPTLAFYSADNPGPFAANGLLDDGLYLNFDVRDRNGLPEQASFGPITCDPPPPPQDRRVRLDRSVIGFSSSPDHPLDPAAHSLSATGAWPACGGIYSAVLPEGFTGRLSAFGRLIDDNYAEPRSRLRSLEGHEYRGLPGIMSTLARVGTSDDASRPDSAASSHGFSLPVEYHREIVLQPTDTE